MELGGEARDQAGLEDVSTRILWLGGGAVPSELGQLFAQHGYTLVRRGETPDTPPARVANLGMPMTDRPNAQPSVQGRRVAVAHSDPGVADGMAQAMRGLGATAAVVSTSSLGLSRIETLQPHVVLFNPKNLAEDEAAFSILRAIWSDPQLRWTPVLLTPSACFDAASGTVDFARMLQGIHALSSAGDTLARRAKSLPQFELPLAEHGPVLTLRALVESGRSLIARFKTPQAEIHVDIAHGIVVGAQSVSDNDSVLGPEALALATQQVTGVVEIERRARPAVTNIMAPLDTAMGAAAAAPDAALAQQTAPLDEEPENTEITPPPCEAAQAAQPPADQTATAEKSRGSEATAKPKKPRAGRTLLGMPAMPRPADLGISSPTRPQRNTSPVRPSALRNPPKRPGGPAGSAKTMLGLQPKIGSPEDSAGHPAALEEASSPKATPTDAARQALNEWSAQHQQHTHDKAVECLPANDTGLASDDAPTRVSDHSSAAAAVLGDAEALEPVQPAQHSTEQPRESTDSDHDTLQNNIPEKAAADPLPEAPVITAPEAPPPPPLQHARADLSQTERVAYQHQAAPMTAAAVLERAIQSRWILVLSAAGLVLLGMWLGTLDVSSTAREQPAAPVQGPAAAVVPTAARPSAGEQGASAEPESADPQLSAQEERLEETSRTEDDTQALAQDEAVEAPNSTEADVAQEAQAAEETPAQPAPEGPAEGPDDQGLSADSEESAEESAPESSPPSDEPAAEAEVSTDAERAPERARRARRISPAARARTLVSLGHRQRRAQKFPLAANSYRQALRLIPGHLQALIGLTQVNIATHNGSAALKTARALVARRPKVGRYHRFLGDAYALNGAIANAQRSWRTAAEHGDRLAKKRLGL